MKSSIRYCMLLWMLFMFVIIVDIRSEEGVYAQTETDIQPDADGCNTKEELCAFLKSNRGGTITLTDDIVWDYTYNDLALITEPTTIEMGSHTIIVPEEGILSIEGSVTLRGEGAVLLETAGMLSLSYGVEIISSGDNAVAIHGSPSASLQLFICKVAAEGADSIAIQWQSPVTVQLSHITGSSLAMDAPMVTIDGSYVSPAPTDAQVVERIPVIDQSLRLYGITLTSDCSFEQYQESIYGYGTMHYAFMDPVTGNAIGGSFGCTWSDVISWPASEGSYTLKMQASGLPEWFPVEIPTYEVPLHIVDPDAVQLHVGYSDPWFGTVSLYFEPYIADMTELSALYCSMDGKTWKNVLEMLPETTMQANYIDIFGLVPDTGYWFYAEVTEDAVTRTSNVIYYPNYANVLDVDFSYGGGDRDEDDYGDQGEVPPHGEIIPPAEEADPPQDEIIPPAEGITSPSEKSNDDAEVPSDGVSSGLPTEQDDTNILYQPSSPLDSSETEPLSGKEEPPEGDTEPPAEGAELPAAEEEMPEGGAYAVDVSLVMVDRILVVLGCAVIIGILSAIYLWQKGKR